MHFGATARDGWTPLYNEKDPFHETFVTCLLAAVTRTIRLSSGADSSATCQTGLVAKQAAADILCEVDVCGSVSGSAGISSSTRRSMD